MCTHSSNGMACTQLLQSAHLSDGLSCGGHQTKLPNHSYDQNRQHHSSTYFGINPVAVLAVVRRAYVRSSYSRRLVSTPDGGTISLDWWNGSLENDLAADVPVLLCLHAFAGVFDIHT